MKHDEVQFLWQNPTAGSGFRTGVCLHGHTLHSKECLSFLPRYLRSVPGMAGVVRRQEQRVDFAKAYWTPPLTPAAALRLEREQIATLKKRPIVSLTDHDDIDGGISLQIACRREESPVSVEWTVPYAGSIFHLGIHNLPALSDRAWMTAMADYTNTPSETLLPAILEGLSQIPEILIVLNHPFWLEEGVESAVHEVALEQILSCCGAWFHAFELNGTRPWKENRDTIALGERHQRPVISGGDRHAGEPSACINLSNAASFAEFAAEVREGFSNVLFLLQYREPMATRILEAAWDILRPYPEYPDRQRWTDRVYYQCEDGTARKLSVLWQDYTPWPLRGAAGLVELFATTGLRSALRLLLADRAGIAL